MSNKLWLQMTRSGFSGTICRYCCAMGHNAKPGSTSFVRSYHGWRDLHVERSGTGTGSDLLDANACVSPYLIYLEACVSRNLDIGSPINKTTRSSSLATTAGRSTFIRL